MPRRYAAADIGSNTVHLLVAEPTVRGGLRRVVNESDWLSLGEVVSLHGEIPEAHAQRLLETLRRYKRTCEMSGVEKLTVFATEAMRVAKNHEELLSRIKKVTGIEVDLISARREAELSLLGISLDTPATSDLLLVEVGGGSAQIAHCVGRAITVQESLPIGTGRLIAKFNLRQPSNPLAVEMVREHLQDLWQEMPSFDRGAMMVASGGVARGVIRALHPDGERLVQEFELNYLVESVKNLSVETIARRFGVKMKRAASLLPGALVFQELIGHFGVDRFTVSEFGVREGAVLEMVRAQVVK